MNELEYLAGSTNIIVSTDTPYSEAAIGFLDALSQSLMKYRMYPDIVAFAFYCRKSNVTQLAERFNTKNRLGRGLVFHIAPSNVAVNFAYSFLFGLLAGNSNIVKVSSRAFERVDIICQELSGLFAEEKFHPLFERNAFVRYPNIDEITRNLSSIADARVIWGGDETITHIRQHPIKVRGVEIAFADRYAACLLNGDAINALSPSDLQHLTDKFYNDVFLFDQNACSSPQIVFWYGNDLPVIRNRFWQCLQKSAEGYDLSSIKVMDKYADLLNGILSLNVMSVAAYGNTIYCVELAETVPNLSGRFGLFYEVCVVRPDEILAQVNDRCQTLTYYGVDKEKLLTAVLEQRISGIDRIVPVGAALNMGMLWDGYDVISCLSRIIDIY
jgi:hypothetical protein